MCSHPRCCSRESVTLPAIEDTSSSPSESVRGADGLEGNTPAVPKGETPEGSVSEVAAAPASGAAMAAKLIGILGKKDAKGSKGAAKKKRDAAGEQEEKGKKRDAAGEPKENEVKVPAKILQAFPYNKPIKGGESEYKKFKVTTDMPSKCWRIKQEGAKQRCVAFGKDPKQAWGKVTVIVAEGMGK